MLPNIIILFLLFCSMIVRPSTYIPLLGQYLYSIKQATMGDSPFIHLTIHVLVGHILKGINPRKTFTPLAMSMVYLNTFGFAAPAVMTG